jgi:hypothetical protein
VGRDAIIQVGVLVAVLSILTPCRSNVVCECKSEDSLWKLHVVVRCE